MELLAFELQSCMGLFIGRFDRRAWEVLIVALGGLDCRSWRFDCRAFTPRSLVWSTVGAGYHCYIYP